MEERPKHSVVNRNPPGCQASRRISRTSRRSSSIGCRSLMIGRRSSAGLLAWTSCQDPSRVNTYKFSDYLKTITSKAISFILPILVFQFQILFCFYIWVFVCTYSFSYKLLFINLDFVLNFSVCFYKVFVDII